MTDASPITLEDGARVAILGGGPSGSFFGYFLSQMAQRVGRELHVDLYEPRDFTCAGPKGCNMCGGIVSESLMQSLATEGIHLPAGVIQRRIDSYFLHMDVGSVRIATPLQEMRIAAVARGAGPRGATQAQESFDSFLLERSVQMGVHHVPERVREVEFVEGRPVVGTDAGTHATYDFLVGAVGVNSSLLKNLAAVESYEPPRMTKAYVAEFMLGANMIERYLGSSMHVFLLDLPRLDFAALIPKSDFVTVCLLGDSIDKQVIQGFLSSKEVRAVLPPHWEVPQDFCHCSPRLNVDTAPRPFGDRFVFIGDCGTTRLFKDGIGAAYRTAKAAAKTAIFQGVSAQDFRRAFWPACRKIHSDNRLGKIVFAFTRQVQRRPSARRALWRMTSREQKLQGSKRRMSRVLWDTFTGSAPYRSVFRRSMHPAFLGRFGMELVAGLRSGETIRPPDNVPLASGETGLTARRCEQDHILYREGEPAACMYVLHDGEVELVREEDGRERQLAVLAGGSFFGETALLGGEKRRGTARVRRDSIIYVLERTDLLSRIHEDPSMAFRLIEHLARRIAQQETALLRAAGESTREWQPIRLEIAESAAAAASASPLGTMGRACTAGEVIYRQGERDDGMLVVQAGQVELVRRVGDHEYLLALLGPGDFFGEMALFAHEIRPDTARAVEDGFVFTLERNGLLRRIHEDPSMALQLITNLLHRLRALEDALFAHTADESCAPLEASTAPADVAD